MKLISKIICAIAIGLVVWSVASYADVISDNCETNPQHSDLNAFVVISKLINN